MKKLVKLISTNSGERIKAAFKDKETSHLSVPDCKFEFELDYYTDLVIEFVNRANDSLHNPKNPYITAYVRKYREVQANSCIMQPDELEGEYIFIVDGEELLVEIKTWQEFNKGAAKKGILPNGIKYSIVEFFNANPTVEEIAEKDMHRFYVSFEGDTKCYPWDKSDEDHYIVYIENNKCTEITLDIGILGWEDTQLYPDFSIVPYDTNNFENDYPLEYLKEIDQIGVMTMTDNELNTFVVDQVQTIKSILLREGLIQ